MRQVGCVVVARETVQFNTYCFDHEWEIGNKLRNRLLEADTKRRNWE